MSAVKFCFRASHVPHKTNQRVRAFGKPLDDHIFLQLLVICCCLPSRIMIIFFSLMKLTEMWNSLQRDADHPAENNLGRWWLHRKSNSRRRSDSELMQSESTLQRKAHATVSTGNPNYSTLESTTSKIETLLLIITSPAVFIRVFAPSKHLSDWHVCWGVLLGACWGLDGPQGQTP